MRCIYAGNGLSGLFNALLARKQVPFCLMKAGEPERMFWGHVPSGVHLVGHAFATLDVIDALAKADPKEPEKASRPFDALRNGFVPGEGAAVLVLEELEQARSRGATIYGEMLSFCSTMSAYHMTDLHASAPEDGVTITRALERANVHPNEIEYINAHGSSTPQNDVFETNSLKAVFGERAYRIPISSTKSMIAHSHSAASSFGIIAVLDASGVPLSTPPQTRAFPIPTATSLRAKSSAPTRGSHSPGNGIWVWWDTFCCCVPKALG